jgi:hypothetical protein
LVELTGALRRQEASGVLTLRQRDQALLRFQADRARWTLLEMDSHVLARAEALAGATPVKTLDALRRAADALGLNVVFVG